MATPVTAVIAIAAMVMMMLGGAAEAAGGRQIELGGSLRRVSIPVFFFGPKVCFGQEDPRLWCVARPGTSANDLVDMEEVACGAGADCFMMSEHGPCYEPNTLLDHVSWAVNSYYSKHLGPCDFKGHAMLARLPSPK